MSDALKSDTSPVDVVLNDVLPEPASNGHIQVTANGGDHASDGNESPITTPLNDVNNVPHPTLNDIPAEIPHSEIDKTERPDDASTMAQAGTPVDQGKTQVLAGTFFLTFHITSAVSIDSANGPSTPVDASADVLMSDSVADISDVGKEEAMAMNALQIRSPAPMDLDQKSEEPAAASPTTTPSPNMVIDASILVPQSNDMECSPDEDQPPPAKRARTSSNADEASLAHVSSLLIVRRYGRADFVSTISLERYQVSHTSCCPRPDRRVHQRRIFLSRSRRRTFLRIHIRAASAIDSKHSAVPFCAGHPTHPQKAQGSRAFPSTC